MAIVRSVNLKSRSVTLGQVAESDLDSALHAAISESHGARVFTATPTPPYDAGDLWAQGSAGDLLMCVTAKTATGAYSAADWALATKYTAGAGSTLDGTVIGTNLVTDQTPVTTGPAWSDVASISITTPGEYDVTAGFQSGTTSPPTGLSCRLVTDNGSLALGPVANRGSVWIGDTNTYSAQPHDLLTVTTTPCKATLQAWSGKTSYINGASIIARRIK